MFAQQRILKLDIHFGPNQAHHLWNYLAIRCRPRPIKRNLINIYAFLFVCCFHGGDSSPKIGLFISLTLLIAHPLVKDGFSVTFDQCKKNVLRDSQ
ncbi:hypothetical protein CDAR_315151 [Caerostris darwini]|uniref:Uncharacterized protein n=1 Tax=Caerostris darwini TaxID=1538125 RepID=A0AAV4TTH9_9ARAC|nr:hypothetical protein CDAR_315151 [Caerostris darwini]